MIDESYLRRAIRTACSMLPALGLFTVSNLACAQSLHLHVEDDLAQTVSDSQKRETSWGNLAAAELEWHLSPKVGLQLGVDLLSLSKSDPPENPRFAPKTASSAQMLMGGVRVYPFGVAAPTSLSAAGVWFDLNAGPTRTGGLTRF